MTDFKRGLLVALMLVSGSLQAKEMPFGADDAQLLQQSCREVLEIFERKNQAASYAAVHTSLAEAMRAGYCIGVVVQYSQQSHDCYSSRYVRSSWFEMAKAIANESIGEMALKRTDVSALLQRAYCYD
ncbi:hypothetical protein [Ferrimonas sp. SCSIO 43195]|uniref:hypothetical protein n=1 Tax=Ferrimonas sp. SCSIO 43195 TaxID=2822844 RepID=UPI0020758741|nr:hypothetical protein [Ferrimonas sp. SCSIO 43195]USD37975.1 hypothetical protein J8Z22_02040 [Ferrimonas sp. SCSIO 43195]